MQNIRLRILFAGAALLAAQVFMGCGDDDTEKDGAGKGGPAGAENGGPDAGDTGNGASTPPPGSGPAFACLRASVKACQELWGSYQESALEKQRADCTEAEGTVVNACPKDDLLGTCTFTYSPHETIVHYYNGYSEPGNPKTMCEGLGVWKDG